jgi:hypothetical protein
MNGAGKHDVGIEKLGAQPAAERPPAAQRLESVLGGELTRFLVTALAGTQAPSRGEPR